MIVYETDVFWEAVHASKVRTKPGSRVKFYLKEDVDKILKEKESVEEE